MGSNELIYFKDLTRTLVVHSIPLMSPLTIKTHRSREVIRSYYYIFLYFQLMVLLSFCKTGNRLEHEWSYTVLWQWGGVRLPLDITANVCTWGTCVLDPRFTCTPLRQQTLQHFDVPTTIGLGCTAHKHFCSICLRLLVLSTLLHRGDTIQGGFIRSQMYYWLKEFFVISFHARLLYKAYKSEVAFTQVTKQSQLSRMLVTSHQWRTIQTGRIYLCKENMCKYHMSWWLFVQTSNLVDVTPSWLMN